MYNRGLEVKIVCLQPHHSTYVNFPNKSFLDECIKPVVIDSIVRFSFFRKTKVNNEAFVKIVDEFKPDVIHSNLYFAELVAYSYIKKEIKYISHIHDNIIQLKKISLDVFFNKFKFTNFYESLWLKRRYKKANPTFLTISKDTNDYIKKNISKEHLNKIELLHNAINLKRFNNLKVDKSYLSLVSTGNLVPKKGHTFLIDVAVILRERGMHFKLLILGFGKLLDELQSKINYYNLQDCIELKGNVKNVNDFLSIADIYLHSADYEPFGLAIIEAMASSLPVICTDAKGNRDLIVEGNNGFMIWERKPSLMADKIELLSKNKDLYDKISVNAFHFSKKFDISNYVDSLITIYSN
jgi:glycosyltransferase involved in cell wall biosynthesis